MKRRSFLVSAAALTTTMTRSTRATSYDPTLAGVKLIAVGLKIISYDQKLRDALAVDANQIKQRIIALIETETRAAGLEPIVVNLNYFVGPPPNILPQSVIRAWIRIDLSRISETAERPIIVGAVSIEFTRDTSSSMSTTPLIFFVSDDSAGEIRSKAGQSAVDYVRSAIIAPYIRFNKVSSE